MSLDKANVTSIIALLFLMVAGYLGLNDLIKDYLVSLAGPIAGLIVWYYTEKHNSELISGSQCTCQSNCQTEITGEEVELNEQEIN